jgi:hypothetical protein
MGERSEISGGVNSDGTIAGPISLPDSWSQENFSLASFVSPIANFRVGFGSDDFPQVWVDCWGSGATGPADGTPLDTVGAGKPAKGVEFLESLGGGTSLSGVRAVRNSSASSDL